VTTKVRTSTFSNAIVAVQVATLEGTDPNVLAKSVFYVDGRHDHFDREPKHIDAL
jgi:hypothetical protein